MYDQADKDKIQLALCSLWETLDKKGEPMTLAKQRGYLMAFSVACLSVEQVERACGIAMTKCTWYPMPAELIGFVTKSVDARAMEAWDNVKRCVVGSVIHSVSAIDLGDASANAALRACGGVQHIGLQGTDSEHEKFTRPRFLEAFRAFAESESVESLGSRSQPLKCLGTQPALILGGGVPAIEDKRDSVIGGLVNGMVGQMKIGAD